MIPIRDDIPSRRYPIVTVVLIVVNVLAFFYELLLGPAELQRFFYAYAVVPVKYFARGYRDWWGTFHEYETSELVLPIFTAMFLHGGWLHLGGNMLYLWIFGDNVEDRMGHFRFLVFYLLCGVAATMAHVVTNADSHVPSLGASGAISGVLGAYFMLYPGARVVTLVPIWIFLHFVEIPAFFFLGFWFLQQFLYGTLSLGVESAQTGGVAWWAHIGGFVAGAVLVHVFKRRDYFRVRRLSW
jgi:membrane associated rhomboid family serine protease